MNKEKIICGFCGAETNIESGEFTMPENSDAISIKNLQERNTVLEKENEDLLFNLKKLQPDQKINEDPKPEEKHVKDNGKKGFLDDIW